MVFDESSIWQGAVTGLVVSGLNHAMHSLGDGEGPGDPPGKFKKFFQNRLKDAKLLKDLYSRYQVGGNKDYFYNASDIDLGDATQSDLGLTGEHYKSGPVYLFKDGTPAQALAFGELEFVRVGNSNRFTITKNKFDFDYHPGSGVKNFARNVGTFAGGALFGRFFETKLNIIPQVFFQQPNIYMGGSFDVIFRGTITIPE